MVDYITPLRVAYVAFYEMPWKTDAMFDLIDEVAENIFPQKEPDNAKLFKLVTRFYDTFVNHARTEDQKSALDDLLRLTLM